VYICPAIAAQSVAHCDVAHSRQRLDVVEKYERGHAASWRSGFRALASEMKDGPLILL
jgi:hypothetical protein